MKHKRTWDPLQPSTHFRNPGAGINDFRPIGPGDPEIWGNRLYQVLVQRIDDGAMVLSIKPKDGSARHDWREFQLIKNEIAGVEREALELYPAESRLVDTANQFFLYVSPPGIHAPFGFAEREVSEALAAFTNTQRSWPRELRPSDVMTKEELIASQRNTRNGFRVPTWGPPPEPGPAATEESAT